MTLETTVCGIDWVFNNNVWQPKSAELSARAYVTPNARGYSANVDGKKVGSNYHSPLNAMAAVEGFTFHDARATAITRLAKKVDVLTLARIVGHKNISQLMTYYRESAEDIAKKLG